MPSFLFPGSCQRTLSSGMKASKSCTRISSILHKINLTAVFVVAGPRYARRYIVGSCRCVENLAGRRRHEAGSQTSNAIMSGGNTYDAICSKAWRCISSGVVILLEDRGASRHAWIETQTSSIRGGLLLRWLCFVLYRWGKIYACHHTGPKTWHCCPETTSKPHKSSACLRQSSWKRAVP